MSEIQHPMPRPKLKVNDWFREIISTLAFVVAVFTLLQLALPRSVVHGRSMEPSFQEGERLVISRVNYLFGDPQRGDIIVFESPEKLKPDEPPLIKRVIGIPGDIIEFRDQRLYRNDILVNEPYINEPCSTWKCGDEIWELGPDQYFMMGDNRNHSNDSREFGIVPRKNIIGEALLRFWPLQSFGNMHQYRFPED